MKKASEKLDPRRIRTGIFDLDRILNGGLPLNLITLICGQEKSFKSTIALKIIKNILDLCGKCFLRYEQCTCGTPDESTVCVYINTERMPAKGYIKNLRIDENRIYICEPSHGEAACEIAGRFARVPEVRAIVIDSLAAVTPIAEIDAKSYMDGQSRGERAKLINRMMRELVVHVDNKEPKIALMINHILPLVDGRGYYMPGGKNQTFLSSVVLQFWKQGLSKSKLSLEAELKTDGDDTRKQELGFLVKSSRVSKDNISGEFAIYTSPDEESGIYYGDTDDYQSVTNWAVKLGFVSVNGSDGEKKRYVVTSSDGKTYDLGPQQIITHWKKHRGEYYAMQDLIIQRTKGE